MTALETRTALPDALRALVAEYPRDGWEAHPDFTELTRFWLDRHLMFRSVVTRLRDGAAARIDGKIDPEQHAREVTQNGRFLLNELKMHHHIEDQHYFPQLMGLDAQVEAGFPITTRSTPISTRSPTGPTRTFSSGPPTRRRPRRGACMTR